MSIHVKDGGEIIRLEEGKLTSELSNEDIARFSLISERLTELSKQRAQQFVASSQLNHRSETTRLSL